VYDNFFFLLQRKILLKTTANYTKQSPFKTLKKERGQTTKETGPAKLQKNAHLARA